MLIKEIIPIVFHLLPSIIVKIYYTSYQYPWKWNKIEQFRSIKGFVLINYYHMLWYCYYYKDLSKVTVETRISIVTKKMNIYFNMDWKLNDLIEFKMVIKHYILPYSLEPFQESCLNPTNGIRSEYCDVKTNHERLLIFVNETAFSIEYYAFYYGWQSGLECWHGSMLTNAL